MSRGDHKVGAYTLNYGFNALCTIEEELGALPTLLQDKARMESAKVVRFLFWAGLQKHHPENEAVSNAIDINRAGDIIDELGAVQAAEAIVAAITKAYPSPSDSGGKAKAS